MHSSNKRLDAGFVDHNDSVPGNAQFGIIAQCSKHFGVCVCVFYCGMHVVA